MVPEGVIKLSTVHVPVHSLRTLVSLGYSSSRRPTRSLPWPLRSEERRVGKECRSLCDWSSDVCSSDLPLLISLNGIENALTKSPFLFTIEYMNGRWFRREL